MLRTLARAERDKAHDHDPYAHLFSCEGKREYGPREVKYYAKKYKQTPYKCPLCAWWHLTKRKGE